MNDVVETLRTSVERIRAASLEQLRSINWVEHELLPAIGLQKDMPEIYPENLRAECDIGIQSFLMPNQFACYLCHLADQGIASYVEISVGQGGAFIVTVEYLSRFTQINRALAVDVQISEQLRVYTAMNPVVELLEGTSQSLDIQASLRLESWDLALIAGNQYGAACRSDYIALRPNVRRIALHNIQSDMYPEVERTWNALTRSLPPRCLQTFVAQYEGVASTTGQKMVGIGLIDFSISDAPAAITEFGTVSDRGLSPCVSRCFKKALKSPHLDFAPFLALDGMSGRSYRKFINTLVTELQDARYLEVGVWKGSTLCSAIADNVVQAVAIDNWSQFGGPKEEFLRNLAEFKGPFTDVRFLEGDFRNIDYASLGHFNVYLFDGPHEEADQFDGLGLALPALDDEFIFVVDDWNWPQVRNGTMRSINATGCEIVYGIEVRSTLDDTHPPGHAPYSEWHNGYFIAVLRKPPGEQLALVSAPGSVSAGDKIPQ